MEEEELDRRLAEAMRRGALWRPVRPPPSTSVRALDEIFASRTHVRVLRALVELDRKLNLTVRGVAGRIGASHSRVLKVLDELAAVGIVTAHRAPSHAIYQLSDRHPLGDAIQALFDEERRTAEPLTVAAVGEEVT